MRKWVPSSWSWTWEVCMGWPFAHEKASSGERMCDNLRFPSRACHLMRIWHGRLLTNDFVMLNEFIQVDRRLQAWSCRTCLSSLINSYTFNPTLRVLVCLIEYLSFTYNFCYLILKGLSVSKLIFKIRNSIWYFLLRKDFYFLSDYCDRFLSHIAKN